MQLRHEARVEKLSYFEDKCLYDRFDDIRRRIDSQLDDHGYGYIQCCITDRSTSKVVNGEPWQKIGVT